MEYKSFEEFYKKAENLAKQAQSKYANFKQAIIYARKSFSRAEMNSFFFFFTLKQEQIRLLQAKTTKIKFSVDSLIKNIIEHPDLKYEDYNRICFILKNADDVILGTYNHLRFFKVVNEKLYEVIVKCTNDNKENFLLSLHRSDLSKLRNLKLKR